MKHRLPWLLAIALGLGVLTPCAQAAVASAEHHCFEAARAPSSASSVDGDRCDGSLDDDDALDVDDDGLPALEPASSTTLHEAGHVPLPPVRAAVWVAFEPPLRPPQARA